MFYVIKREDPYFLITLINFFMFIYLHTYLFLMVYLANYRLNRAIFPYLEKNTNFINTLTFTMKILTKIAIIRYFAL